MADSGPCQDTGGKNAIEEPQRKRKRTNEPEWSNKTIKPEVCEAVDITEVNESLSKLHLGNEKHHGPKKATRMLSEMNSNYAGISYQSRLANFIYWANVKKSKNSVNKFIFEIKTDDPTAGIFNDIVCTYNDGGQTGSLKMYVKPSFGSPTSKLKLNDFISTDIMKPFAILNMFTKFYDQSTKMTDLERLIICTNSDIDDDARDLWKAIDPAVTCESTTLLDSYVSTLFTDVGGKFYRLNYDRLTDGTFNDLYQSCREYSKRTRLAKLLVNAVKSKKDRLMRENSVVNEYYQAITSIIDKSDREVKGSYRFTNEFLESSKANPPPGYRAFRLEFEEEYSQKINVWEELKNKRLHVEEDFLLNADGRENDDSVVSFPGDDIDKHLQTFCQSVRLICDTKSGIELDETKADLRNQSDGHLCSELQKRIVEKYVTSEKPKPKIPNQMNPFVTPMISIDIDRGFPSIASTSVSANLQKFSDNLRIKVGASPFRIRVDALKASDLYRRISCENFFELDVYDVHFGAAVTSDIVRCQSEGYYDILFSQSSEFIKDSHGVKRLFLSNEHCNCLIIICYEMFLATQEIVQEWKKDFLKKNSSKQVVLIRKTSTTPIDLSCFRICDIAKESWKQWLMSGNIPLCSTTISPTKLFETKFQHISIEELIKLLDWGKEMETKNAIVKKYRQIESTYVHRLWMNHVINPKAEHSDSFDHFKMEHILNYNIHVSQKNEISFMKITEHIERHPQFKSIFQEVNNPMNMQELFIVAEAGKVLILLGEAGCGKSTYLTWLAWDLLKQNSSTLVVRCNLSDYCTEFEEYVTAPKKESGKEINETDALKLLYKLVHLSLEHEQEKAEICSTCLSLSNGQASVNEDQIKHIGVSFNNSIELLVFEEKFNARKLILLFDGFDEIEHGCKEVVLKCLSLFAQLYGVSNLFLTSRPYNCKEKFEKAFKNPTFYQLKPLSLQDKGSMLYKMMKEKWRNRNIDDTQTSNFCKALCLTHLHNLNDLIDNPLNLKSSIGIFVSLANRYINFHSKLLNLSLFTQSKRTFKPSFIVEEFANTMIRRHLNDKNYIEEAKQKIGLVALWVLFDKSILHNILSPDDIKYAMSYMNEIQEFGEKTGIINGIRNGVPRFIHQIFAEVLCARWILYRIRWNQQSITMSNNLESYWDPQRRGLRMHIDTILAKRHPLHLAIIDKDWSTVESILSSNPKSLYERDDGNRTPFHLMALYYDFERDWPHFLPDSVESDIINAIENVFAWTALDYAFHRDKPQLICYLLQHGASINFKVLYEQVVSTGKDKICKAATYARYVMRYLSSEVIVFESHDVRKKIKLFCDKVVAKLDDKTSANSELILDRYYKKGSDNDCNGEKMVEDIIKEDSSCMLESIIQRWAARKHFVRMIINSFFNLQSKTASIFVLRHLMAKDPCILKEDILWDCIIFSVIRNWNDEFKYFFDLYCSRIKIKYFQPCLIKSASYDYPIKCDVAGYFIDYVENNVKNLVCDFRKNICWSKLVMPTEIMIDENIFSLLVICVATVRPSMLMYLTESCKWNLCAGIVFSLALITNHLLSKIHRKPVVEPNPAYKCLLDHASYINDVKANKMLRLAITSQLFEFSKCLIERFQIDLQAIDEINGWNVFHLCASNQRSFWVDEKSSDRAITPYADDDRTDLFCYMLARVTAMDCFGLIDKRGRSILHLAIENEQRGIVEHIVAQKLGLIHINEIRNLRVDAIPNITFCYRVIREISKSVGDQFWLIDLICILAKQIAKISLTNREESQELNSVRLLLHEDAKELYQIAMKCRSLFLMYYLHREIASAIPPLTYDADWLACTERSMYSPDFLDVTKWLFNPNEVNQIGNLYEVVEECDYKIFDFTSVDLKQLIKQAAAILSANRSVEELCKLKLLALAVCLKRESMIRHLCESFNVNIDWKVLIDIVIIAHQSYIYEPGTKDTDKHTALYMLNLSLYMFKNTNDTDECGFEKPNFIPIYKYLLERTSNLGEIDAEGRNVLHLAAQSGLGCMAKFLIKNNMVNVTTINEQNGWNIFHYYASRKLTERCCNTENDQLLTYMTKRVLGITSDDIPLSSTTESRKNKLQELCFNSNDGRKSVIHVAVEAGNITTAEYIIQTRLGCGPMDEHEIRNSDECSRFRECYDELCQITTQLPFNALCDYLLHILVKPILRFSPQNIEHITGKENGEDHIIEDACRSAIRYRSLITLDHLIIACEYQMNEALARSTNHEVIVCMMECIRRNRTSMFKVFVGHYRTLQGILPRVEVEYDREENDNIDEVTFNESLVKWGTINEFTEDVAMNRDYLPLLILSVAYGRLLMTRYLVEMLQLEVNKSLIVLIMKVLQDLWDQNCKTATPVYEYLAKRCEGTPSLLHLCIQAELWTMIKFLIKDRKLDPNEIDQENGWNAGHYCVSDPNVKSGYDEFTWLVDQYNMDCFGVFDLKGRNILHYALENDLRRVKYIINHRLGLVGDKQPWYEWDSEKIEILINELRQTIKSVPDNIPQKPQQVIQDILDSLNFYLINTTTGNFGQIFHRDCKNDNERSGKENTEDIIGENSLERVIQREINEKLFIELIRKLCFDLALRRKSVFVMAYLSKSDPFILPDEYLWKFSIYAALKNCNIEFKFFFDLYCSRLKIKDFQPCSIQIDKAYKFIDYSKSDEIDEVCDSINNICWSKFGILVEFMINEKILSLLVICVAKVRPSILRYLIESCKLNLCAGIVFSLVMISYESFLKTHRKRGIKLNQSYNGLLDLASNITDVEANKMLRLAITSQLIEFSEYLIERFNIDFQAVDEIEGWNVFHLCASNQRAIWIVEIPADDTRTPHVDRNKTKLFCYMLAKETNMDCFGIIDKKGRSILHLAMENGQRGIVEHILARKLGLNHMNEFINLRADAISNITFCYRAIREISKSVEEQWWHYALSCILAKQIAKISLTNREESQESNSDRSLLQEDATELFQMAIKSRSLFLMYYLHREFPSAIPPLIYDAYWLMCTVDSLRSPDFLDVTKWLLNPNEVDKHGKLYEVVEECDAQGFDYTSVNLEKLLKQVEAILSANRSVEEVCKLKLLALAVCLKRESMIRHLCETFNVNINWKVLIDIMEIAHHSYLYEPGTKDTDVCAFEKPDFIPIYKYLFERTYNLGEIDAEGRNVLHLAAQNGLGCMAKFLIKHNMINDTTTNEQNGWNIFHYYASRKNSWKCCYTENDKLLTCMTKRVLEITSDDFPLSSLTECRKNKIKELCFNSDEGRKCVIHVAVEAGNIGTAEYIIECRLGIGLIDEHEIRNSDECSRFRECYDELSQIAAQLPFNGWYENLLYRLAKSILRFSPENIDHITGQENVEDHVVEDACRSAIKYRSLITLEHLIIACEDQMNQALARSTSYELVSCMMECMRRNRTSMFKVLVGHCRSLQGIQPIVEVEFEVEENDNIDEVTINEKEINWPTINEFTEDLAMNQNFLPLLILSVAYGRLSMTRYLVEMLQLEVNKSLIVLIMKVLECLWDRNCDAVTPVYEYLANRCEGKPNLLYLCTQAGCTTMLKYLIKEGKLDPNEVDSENGMNVGHYCVSDPNVKSGYDEFTWLVDQYNMDCFGVFDLKGRNILHLALENDRDQKVKYIINHRLGLIGDKQPWYEWESEKIEKLIDELQQTIKSLPENIPHQEQQVIRNILEKVRFQKDSLTTYQQLFTNQT